MQGWEVDCFWLHYIDTTLHIVGGKVESKGLVVVYTIVLEEYEIIGSPTWEKGRFWTKQSEVRQFRKRFRLLLDHHLNTEK